MSTRPTCLGLLLGVLLLLISAEQPRACGQDADPKASPADKEVLIPGTLDSRTFELLIVGPDGKPVPKAQFEIRMGPKPKEWIFHRGELSPKKSRYGTIATTDEAGAAAFEIPSTGIEYFSIDATNPGFGPFWAQWNPGENTSLIPESYTVHLDAGVTIGGITVDDEGKPIAGVSVHPSIEFKKRDDDLSQLSTGARVKSDENGKWSYPSVPAAFESLSVRLDHPDYIGAQGLQLPLKDYTVPAGAEPTQPVVVPRGEVVTGTVKGADGKPVVGARVRAKFSNSEREAIADEQGAYRLKGCRSGSAVLFATAKGHGPETARVDIHAGMASVDFQLPAPKTIRVRVVDGAGKPIPKSRIFFRTWRANDYGYGLGLQLTYANEQGVWEWNEAPADSFVADICPPGRSYLSDQTLMARDEDYVFTFTDASLPAAIFGSVVDRVTGQPIPRFRVVPGLGGFSQGVLWTRRETFDGKDGKFYFQSSSPRPGYQFRVEAPGYLTADSEYVVSKGGNSNVQVQMMPGEWLKSKVLLPGGEPAAGATIAIGLAGTQIHFRDGSLSEGSSYCDRRTTDAEGKFEFPSQVGRFELFVTHPAGSATVAADPGELIKPLTLTPWARLRGVVKVGKEPAAGVSISLNHHGSMHMEGRPNLGLYYSATSGPDGSFEWSRVFPGTGSVSKAVRIHVMPNGYSERQSHAEEVELRAGEVTEVTIGGRGRAVTGTFAAAGSLKGPHDWNFAVVTLEKPGGQWTYSAAVQRDGKFRLDDIAPGDYTLTAELCTPSVSGFGPGPAVATLRQPLKVTEDSSQVEAMDLGTLMLKGVGEP